jgi:hypothetical protein
MGKGKVLLEGTPEQVFAEVELLASTFVLPPAAARIGTAAGLPDPPLSVDGLLDLV